MRQVTLDDKYSLRTGEALMTGVQAIVRLTLSQRERDRAAGLDTAGYVSGYRGSPLGAVDIEFWRARSHLERNGVIFEPGVNEELAATAVWGTQMLRNTPRANKDGVFALWYGKGPGLDRSGDALKHGNAAGASAHGGVLIIAGDDHAGKSSTVAHQSEFAFIDAHMPVLAPSNVQDVLDLGLLGIAMSRYSGLYVGFKLCNEVCEQTSVVRLDIEGSEPVLPEPGELPPEGIHNHPTFIDRQRSELVLKRYRWKLLERFIRANKLNRVVFAGAESRLGIVTAGKAFQDVLQALSLLGLDETAAGACGISLYKLGCVYPLDRGQLGDFADRHAELLFIEEKDALAEHQAKTLLYGRVGAPRIVGKTDENGEAMIPSDSQLEPIQLACVIAERLRRVGADRPGIAERAAVLAARIAQAAVPAADAVRAPYFCSGCPHSTGTRTPDGSIAAAGIGCHTMAIYSGAPMLPNTQMGGEGAHWYSLAKFSDMPHIFQNMGDGTYYHSGLLAIRGAVAAKVNITFRVLFNDAVAMTGGQPVDGPISVGSITKQVLAEGATRCAVVTDSPHLYGAGSGIAGGVRVHHRDEYDAVQREFREIKGVSVIIYEQTCAAEKRRRRKRKKMEDPRKRLFINEAVCEGCGDCSVQSNCVSLWPKETEFGRKRQIDQSSCNKDYSCVKGFCPSFVTVLDAEPRKRSGVALSSSMFEGLPRPGTALSDQSYSIMVSGIGGTGVVTVGALLGMAAHIDGNHCSVFDMTGLSQKNGAVFSHVRIAKHPERLGSQKIGLGEADLALAFDAVAALSREAAVTLSPERTKVVVNSRVTPTAAFQRNPDLRLDERSMLDKLAAAGAGGIDAVDATGLGLALLGDSIAANMFLLGFAAQRGSLPVSVEALTAAIEINAVAVQFNKTAFALGRLYAERPTEVTALLPSGTEPARFTPLTTVREVVAHRVAHLTAYQDARYAERYRALVQHVSAKDADLPQRSETLTLAVARNFAKLMAYKDEYEVARLMTDAAFKAELRATFEDGAKIRYNLAPPILSRRDAKTGRPAKREFGAWIEPVFRVLARMRSLRGTAFDPFGYTAERRMERDLIAEYEAMIRDVCSSLTPDRYDLAVQLAESPQQIRGYGPVKEASVVQVRARWQRLRGTVEDR